jgi:hypothetical protein
MRANLVERASDEGSNRSSRPTCMHQCASDGDGPDLSQSRRRGRSTYSPRINADRAARVPRPPAARRCRRRCPSGSAVADRPCTGRSAYRSAVNSNPGRQPNQRPSVARAQRFSSPGTRPVATIRPPGTGSSTPGMPSPGGPHHASRSIHTGLSSGGGGAAVVLLHGLYGIAPLPA